MAFTKVVGAGIHTLSNITSHNINSSGIITATKFVGPFDGSSGDFSGNVTVDGNLVVNGDTTTLNTTLREVELLRVDANSSTAAGIITQTGSGDLLQLFDGSTQVGTITDDGNFGIGNISSPNVKLHVKSTATGGGNIAYFDDSGSGTTGRLMILTTGGTASADGIKFQTVNRKYTFFGNATNHLTIDNNNARIGIGSDIPTAKLEVHQSGTTGYLFRAMAGLSVGNRSYDLKPPSSDSLTEPFSWNTGNSHSFQVDGVERLRITDGGSLQVKGDTNPNAVFDRGSANTTNVNFNYNGTLTGQLGAANQEFQISAAGSSTPLVMYVNGSERVRINSAGQIITNGNANPFPTRGLTIRPNAGQTNNYISIIAGNTSSVSGVTFGTSADNDANNYRAMFEYYHSGFAHNEGLRFLALGTEKFRIRGGSTNAGDILYGSGDHVIGASPGLLNGLGSHNNANPASVMYGIDDGGGYNGMKVINFDDGTYNSQKIEFLTGKGGVSMATVRMSIDENGLVGINSTTPDKRLTIMTSNEDALLIKNTNTAQYNSARIHLQSMGSATDNITAFVHGNDNTGGSNSYFAIESKNSSHGYIKTLMLYKHNGDYWDINAGASGSASVRILDKVLNVGGNFDQTSAPLSVTTDANDYGIRLLTGSNVVFDAMNNDSAGNCEVRGYYNNNSGTQGMGFRLEASGETYFNPGGVTGLSIKSTGQTTLTRGSQGGREHTGNNSNFFKIGTWYGINTKARLKITVFGSTTYDNNTDVAGETIIYISNNANNTMKGHFHSIVHERNGVQKVAFKMGGGNTNAEVWIKYNGGYSCTRHKVDASEGYWVGADTDTGSTSVPSGATEATAHFAISLSDGSQSYERFRINSSGNVLCGGTGVSQTNRQLVVGSNAEANLAIETHNTSASETANIRFYRSRGTAASPTTLVDNDVISQLMFYGHDGTDYAHAAGLIRVKCNGTVAGNQMPGEMSFHTNHGTTYATQRLKIQANGRITMGEADFDASNDLHLKKANSGGDVAMRITNNSGTNSGTTASLYFTTSPTQDFNTSYIQAVRDGGKLNFGYSTNSPTVCMRVSNRHVGINTDNPTSLLEVHATQNDANNLQYAAFEEKTNGNGQQAFGLTLRSTARNNSGLEPTAFIKLETRAVAADGSHGGNAFITFTPQGVTQGTYGSGRLDFYIRTGGPYTFNNDPGNVGEMSPMMSLTPEGDGSSNLRLGATSATNIYNSSGTGNEGAWLVAGGASQFSGSNTDIMRLNRKSYNGKILLFYYNGSEVGSVSTNANSLPSDRNFKTNISDLNLGLSFVNKLKPSKFNYKIDEPNTPVMYGLIAQELEESLTSEGVSKNSTQLIQHHPTDDTESDYDVDYGKLTPVLINAVKELSTEINNLKAKVAALEGS